MQLRGVECTASRMKEIGKSSSNSCPARYIHLRVKIFGIGVNPTFFSPSYGLNKRTDYDLPHWLVLILELTTIRARIF